MAELVRDDYNLLRVSADGDGIVTVLIDNPPANALTDELYGELTDLVAALETDGDVRAVVFASEHPKVFVSGADVKRMAEYDFRRGPVAKKIDLVHGTFLRLQRFIRPTVAAIEGHALGGGCELALCMDFRFMARGSARIGLPETSLGIIPGGGGTQRLARLLGRARAAELIMLARRLDAAEAERVGLVNAACEDGPATREAARACALQLARMPASALEAVKRCLNDGLDSDLPAGLAVEREAAIDALLSPAAKEGIAAFLEKRDPRFTT